MSYQIGDDYNYVTDTFLLSGYYKDYISTRTNNRGYIYVSTAFKDHADALRSGDGVSAMIRFQNNDDVGKSCEELQCRIDFTDKQTFEIVPTGIANGGSLVWAVIALAGFISFSGYLLVYNILYISVVKEVQFYGQLKTIGMTGKQIKRTIYKQIIWISCIGIPAGLVLGAAVSFGAVPYALKMLYANNSDVGIKRSFSPLIFAGAAVFTFATAMIAGLKPAKIAGGVSPIAALRYTPSGTKAVTRKYHKVKLFGMAWNNVFRNVKSSALVFASLFCGFSLFLIVTGLLHGLSPENYVSVWGESDFAITYSIHEDRDLITDKMVSEIKEINGIKNLRLTYAASEQVTTDVVCDDNVFHNYLMSLDGLGGLDFSDSAELKAYQQNFYSGVYGIDSIYVEEINQALNNPVDMTAFEQGDIVLLSKMADSDGNDLIKPGQEITIKIPNGQHTFTVADGFLDADFQAGRGSGRGTAPNLYISQAALQELFPKNRVFRMAFDTDGQQDEDILLQLKLICAAGSGIDISSRYEKREEMRDYLITANVLGTGTSVILLLVGMMNFVNTMAVNVNTRRYELAILESIGMTRRQIRQMLSMEGCCYWGISFFLVATVGTAIYRALYLIFS